MTGALQEGLCDVCDASGHLRIVASQFGPASFAACQACEARDAEPFIAIAMRIWSMGGPDGDLSELTKAVTFLDGQYAGLDAVLARYDDKLAGEIHDEFFG